MKKIFKPDEKENFYEEVFSESDVENLIFEPFGDGFPQLKRLSNELQERKLHYQIISTPKYIYFKECSCNQGYTGTVKFTSEGIEDILK